MTMTAPQLNSYNEVILDKKIYNFNKKCLYLPVIQLGPVNPGGQVHL